jgi:hypothetical protein
MRIIHINMTPTPFENAVNRNNYVLISIFIHQWASDPSWRLHDEIYKLQEKYNLNMLIYVDNILSIYKNKHPLVNHARNLTNIAILTIKN